MHMPAANPVVPLAPFDFAPRTRLVFGAGSLSRLGELTRQACPDGNRVLLVTDHGLVAAGHVETARAILAGAGWEVTVHSDVHANPTTEDVARCLEVARAAGVQVLVGLGGGSSLDTAKGANFLLTNGGVMQDYWGVGKATRPMLPLVAVPTTAGTGSECQSAALIADAVTHRKMACLDPKAAPRIALLDPELTVSLPRGVTAATGVDALAHALESAVTRKLNPISEMYSRDAFVRCVAALPVVLEHPGDVDARGQMLLGAAHAGIAIESSMLGAAHAAANPLTAHHGTVHGVAVGLMLTHVVRFNAADPASRRRYANLAQAAGIAGPHLSEDLAVQALVDRLGQVLDVAGIPRSLAEAGVTPDDVERLAADASQQWTGTFNPRTVDVDAFRSLYRAALRPR